MLARIRVRAAFALAAFGTISGCSDGTATQPGSSGGVGGGAVSTPTSGSGGVPSSAGTTTTSGTGGAVSSGGVSGAAGTQATAGTSAGGAGGTGGSGGAQSGGAGGSGGSAGSTGGADPEGWVDIFNGQDLTNWVPLIHKSGYNENTYNTFRADAVNHVIRVTYVDYPNNNFDDRCGLLYYNKPLTNYRVRATYHFVDEKVEPQAKMAVSWGRFNTGLMIFGLDPSKVMNDPEFPPLIEIQLLGKGSSGGSTSPNICTPGPVQVTYNKPADCGNNGSGVVPPEPTTWVTVEAEVHPGAATKVWTYSPGGKRDEGKPIETITNPTYQNAPVTSGYISIQSESQPCEFKDIQLIELPN